MKVTLTSNKLTIRTKWGQKNFFHNLLHRYHIDVRDNLFGKSKHLIHQFRKDKRIVKKRHAVVKTANHWVLRAN